MNRITNAVNIIEVILHSTISIICVEKCYINTGIAEKSSLECFLAAIQNQTDTMVLKYRNLGKGYLEIYGINTEYQYTVILYVENPLRQLYEVINTLGYAVIPVKKSKEIKVPQYEKKNHNSPDQRSTSLYGSH